MTCSRRFLIESSYQFVLHLFQVAAHFGVFLEQLLLRVFVVGDDQPVHVLLATARTETTFEPLSNQSSGQHFENKLHIGSCGFEA